MDAACPGIAGYVAFPDMTHAGDDLGAYPNSRRAAAACSSDSKCLAVTSSGLAKSAFSPMSSAPGSCLFVKSSAAVVVPTSEFMPYMRAVYAVHAVRARSARRRICVSGATGIMDLGPHDGSAPTLERTRPIC